MPHVLHMLILMLRICTRCLLVGSAQSAAGRVVWRGPAHRDASRSFGAIGR